MIVVADDEDGENGRVTLMLAEQMITPEAINFTGPMARSLVPSMTVL
jgi:hypothetical protein